MRALARMSALGSALVAASLLSACGDGLAVLPPPPVDGEMSTLVLAIDTEDSFEVRVVEVIGGAVAEGTFPLRLAKPVPAGKRVTLEAVGYPASPARLGLTPGVLVPVTSSTARTLELDMGASLHRLQIESGDVPDAPAWVSAEAMSAKLATFRVGGLPTGCADFDARRGVIGSGTRSPAFSAEVEPGRVLVGTELESFFTVRVDEVQLVSTPTQQGYRTLAASADGTLWFGGDYGSVARGHFRPELRIDQVLQTETEGQIRWLVTGPGGDQGRDVFTLSREGELEHHSDSGSFIIHRLDLPTDTTNSGGMAWVGPRHAIVAWPSVDRQVLRARFVDGRWAVGLEQTDGTAAFISAAYNPALGAIVGNSDGQFYLDRGRGRGWERMEGSELRLWPFSMAPYEDGFVYGTAFGNFGQYTPADGFCPLAQVHGGDLRQIVVAGQDLFMTGPSGGRQPAFVWLDRR